MGVLSYEDRSRSGNSKCFTAFDLFSRCPDLVGLVRNGWLAVKGEDIVAVGNRVDVESSVSLDRASRVDATGKVVAPGFVDCHTHWYLAARELKSIPPGLSRMIPLN